MKGRIIAMGEIGGRAIAALMVDGQLEDLALAAPEDSFGPGAILRGKVERLMKGQGGVFVRLPEGTRGYLRDRKGLSEGQPVLVQVSGVAEPGKALPLSGRILFRGRYGIVSPQAPGVNVSRAIRDEDRRETLGALGNQAIGATGFGLILRSAAEPAPDADIAQELGELVEITTQVMADETGAPELLLDAPEPEDTAWRDWAVPAPDAVDTHATALDDSGALDAIMTLAQPEITLPGSASAMIEPTRALIAIDVNTGADNSPAAALKANIALARDLPRQLRLRGLGGQVVVDFAPIPKRDRGTLEQVLRAAFKREQAETTLVGWTAMGLYEINRKRDRAPLADWLKGGA